MVSIQHLFWDCVQLGGARCPSAAENMATRLPDTAAYRQAGFKRGAITSGVAGLIANTAVFTSGKCTFEDVVGTNDNATDQYSLLSCLV